VRKRLFREPPPPPTHRVNDRIRFSPVRLIDGDGEQVGVVPIDEARTAARERGLDLVEIAPNARPPVCKMLDYGKFRFEMEKKAKEAKRAQHQIEIKEVKFRPNISDHDFATKLGRARRFLRKGAHVKVTVMFRRREMRRPDMGYQILDRVVDELDDVASVENRPPDTLQGRDLTMVLRAD
jgi:translation initiation factor IF-3